jgi:hypothetical protein
MTRLPQTSLGAAFALQRTIDRARIVMVGVEDDLFGEFSELVQRLIIRLGPRADEDGPWEDAVRTLRGIRSRLTLSPGDADSVVRMMELPAGWPDGTIGAVRPFGEEEAQLVERAWETVLRMGDGERELGRALRTVVSGLNDIGRSRIVVKPALVAATRAWLTEHTVRFPEVITSTALGGETELDRLVVVGPAGWFPDHLRTVPRAEMTFVLAHAWVKDRTAPTSLLEQLNGHVREVAAPVIEQSFGKRVSRPDLQLDATALLPGFSQSDLERMARRALTFESEGGGARVREDDVEARMFVLASGEVVFLPTNDASTRDVAESSHEGISVSRLLVGELKVGMFLLVRRTGAQDYLIEMADRLLAAQGEDPIALRRVHSRWQHALREFVSTRGPTIAAKELRAVGVMVANAPNVGRWMSGESLGLRKDAHFLALLKHLGLAEEARGILLMTRHLRYAHQSAGARLRQLLVDRAQRLSPAELEAAGHVDVELDREGGGTLMLARIEQIAEGTVMVPAGRIGLATAVT